MMRRVTILLGAAWLWLSVSGGAALAEWRYDPAAARWVRTPSAEGDVDTQVADNQLQRAVDAFEAGDLARAEQIADSWLRYYQSRRDSQAAWFLLAEARRGRGHDYQAYEAYEKLLDSYAGTDLFDRVLELETQLADGFLNHGRKRTLWQVFRVEAADEAQEMLERVFQRDPRGKRGKAALKMLADYHFKHAKFVEAKSEYQKLAENFARDADADGFRLLAAQAALGQFQGISRDPIPLADAEQQFRQVKQINPQLAQREQVDGILAGIDERRAEKDLAAADWYRKAGKAKSAIFYYRAILRDYPGSATAGKARNRLVGMGVTDIDEPTRPPVVLSASAVDPKAAQRQIPDANAAAPNGRPGGIVISLPAHDAPIQTPTTQAPPLAAGTTPRPIMLTPGDAMVIDIGLPSDAVLPVDQPVGSAGPLTPTTRPDGTG